MLLYQYSNVSFLNIALKNCSNYLESVVDSESHALFPKAPSHDLSHPNYEYDLSASNVFVVAAIPLHIHTCWDHRLQPGEHFSPNKLNIIWSTVFRCRLRIKKKFPCMRPLWPCRLLLPKNYNQLKDVLRLIH